MVLLLLLAGCETSGDIDELLPPDTGPESEEQSIRNLLDLYSATIAQEDIDRLNELLPQLDTSESELELQDVLTFRRNMTRAFRAHAIIGHHIPDSETKIAADRRSVSFLEVESTEEPATLVQRTRVFETTFTLQRGGKCATDTFCIIAIQKGNPLVEVMTRGQILAGTSARVEVRATAEAFAINGVNLEVPETRVMQTLTADGDRFQGVFVSPRWLAIEPTRVQMRGSNKEVLVRSRPQPLRVRIARSNRADLLLSHHYCLQAPEAGVVERIPGTESTRLSAVAIDADNGAVWIGGDEQGRLYRVEPGSTTATFDRQLLNRSGRVEDLTIDSGGRLDAVVFPPQRKGQNMIIVDQETVCPKVNALSPEYPLQIQDRAEETRPSPSTRALATIDNHLWLFGSDGGTAKIQVPETFPDGPCPEEEVTYESFFTRQPDALLSNTVPALTMAMDGALWFGTILGVTRFHNGQFTPFPFEPELSLSTDRVTTLEHFFGRLHKPSLMHAH